MIAALWGACLGLGIALLVTPGRRSTETHVSAAPRGPRHPDVVRHVAAGLACGVTGGIVGWLATGSLGIGLVGGLSTGLVPFAVMRSRRAARARERERAWVDVVDQLVGSLRSGQTLTHAVMGLATHRVSAIRRGAQAFVGAVTTTADVTQSLSLLAREWDDPTGDRLVATLRLAHDIGGSGAVAALAGLGREVHRESGVRSEIRARQAWLRVATWVSLSAPWLVVAFLSTRPEGRLAYSSDLGSLILVIGFVTTLVAYGIMSRVARPVRTQRVFDS